MIAHLLYFIIGLIVGSAFVFILYKIRKSTNISSDNSLNDRLKDEVEMLRYENNEKDGEVVRLTSELSAKTENLKNIEEKLDSQKKEIVEVQEKLQKEFRLMANEILNENSEKFTKANREKIDEVLKPLKEQIQVFERKVEDTHKVEIRERVELRKELEQIIKLNQQVSEDATRLTNALKGDSKIQGNWGEMQLETILEKAGLEKDIHYKRQETLKDDEGKNHRPDFIINMPDDKNLILDSKVSLTAYENYFNTDDKKERISYLSSHLISVNKHITELGNKNYQTLYGINQPDYVLVFFPIESALALAIKDNKHLFDKCLDKNIVLVSVSTLLATLRTISYIWKQENQKRNVVEIARESGKLYDKFVGFVDDLIGVGRKIDDAKISYSDAMNKLVKSTKKGDTIVGRIERIKNLGADTTKTLPQQILNRIEE